jgi:hypothetical protein
MDNKESESWVTGVYQEFWDKAEELAEKEIPDNTVTFAKAKNVMSKMQRRDKHLESMKEMFIATMLAPVDDDSDEGNDNEGDDGEPDCAHCPNLLKCQEQWETEQKQIKDG